MKFRYIKLVLLLLFVFPVVMYPLLKESYGQPPAAYKKQMKQQKKAEKKAGKVKGNKRSSEKIKKYKQQITRLEKQEMDARASRDQEKADKTKRMIGRLKAKVGIEKDKLTKKIIKKYQKIQTKKVRKRMKKSNRKANRVNENKREFFLIRWFSPKHRK